MKTFVLFGICIFSFLRCFSQPKTRTELSGVVSDQQSGLPLSGASVVLADSRTGTVTDSLGHYILKNIPVGHTIIEVSHSGYKTLVEHLDISTSDEHHFSLAPSMLENEGVTVTAVARATSIRKTPIPITRVNKSELLATPSTNIIDALSRQPGVSQLSTGPAISKPIIRGLGYNRLVVINDGIRQEGQQWGDEHGVEVDENSVNSVEIVKGPASLIYGSDAIAGVVNIITTTPLPVNTIRGTILTQYATNNHQRSLFANLGGNNHGFNWNGWADYKAAADYRNPYDGRVYNSRFNERNMGGYAGYNASWGYSHLIMSSFNQRLGVIEGERDATGAFVKQLPGSIQTPASEDDFNSVDPQIPYQHVRHLKLVSDNSIRVGKGRINLNLGWQKNNRQEYGDPDNPGIPGLDFDLQTLNYSAMYHFPERKGWNTSMGFNGMAQANRNGGEEVLIPEYGLFDIGGFLFTQRTFGPLSFSGGVRYNYRSLDTKELMEGQRVKFEELNRTYANFSASGGLSYSPSDHLVLKLNLASGFRSPSVPELASNGTHEGTNRYEYGNSELKSERSIQPDLGIEFNSDHLMISANLFYNQINNFIFYNKLASVNGGDSLVQVDSDFIPAFQFNQRDAQLMGGELLVDLHPHPLDWLHWQNSLSFVRGIFTRALEGDKDLPLIPAPKWVSEWRAGFLKNGNQLKDLTAYFDLEYNFRQEHFFGAYNTETPTPGYVLLNAGLSTRIMYHHRTLFSLYLSVVNLADKAYQQHLSRLKYTDVNPVTGRMGVYNMGRNFMVKLNVPFSF